MAGQEAFTEGKPKKPFLAFPTDSELVRDYAPLASARPIGEERGVIHYIFAHTLSMRQEVGAVDGLVDVTMAERKRLGRQGPGRTYVRVEVADTAHWPAIDTASEDILRAQFPGYFPPKETTPQEELGRVGLGLAPPTPEDITEN